MKLCEGCHFLNYGCCSDGFFPSERQDTVRKCSDYRAYYALRNIGESNPLFFERLESGLYNFDRNYFLIDYGKKTCTPISNFEKFLETEAENLLEGKKRLIISGDMGTGKTTLALYFMRTQYRKLYEWQSVRTGCYTANSAKFYQDMRKDGLSREMLFYPLLFIDDLFIDSTGERQNFRLPDWGERGYFIANTKLLFEEARGFFIITSNIKPTEVDTKKPESLWITQTLDRIRYNAIGIHVEGSSKRAGGVK